MGKVIFTISYDIDPEKREEFLALTNEMRKHIQETTGRDYAVFEQKGKKNSFSEIFICASMEDYEQLEDQDERTEELVQRLQSLLVDGKMKYTTLVELQ